MQEIITTEWFQAMIEDCEAIITERRFNSAMELIQCKWEIGNRILEDWDNIERFKYGSKIVETLSKILGMSPSHLYKCIEFARKFKTWNEAEEALPDGKATSWYKVSQQLLPETAEKEKELKEQRQENCNHFNFQVIVRCKDCGKKVEITDNDIREQCRKFLNEKEVQ